MKTIKSCEFNMDTGCVELRFQDGSMISIDCTAVENEVADNRFQRSELDYLIYNDPLAYADLILNGDVEAYLNAVTEYKPYENGINAQKGMAVCHPLCHAVLGVYIPWICLISIVRRRSRRFCPCTFLPRPAPPAIRQIPAALPHSRKRQEYPAAEFGRCSRSHAAGCRCCW